MLKLFFAFILAVCVAVFVAMTWHWPFVGDEAIIRYINFLMHSGMAPYRDIVDVNMPGAYAVDWLAMHIFGSGSLAWRMFDFTLMAVAAIAAMAIAWPYDWFAGIYAGALFILIHGRDGVAQTGQRDLTMSVLVLAATALLFYGRRKNCWVATALFGILCGSASTIKPTVLPLGFVLLLMFVIDLRRRQYPVLRHGIGGLIGLFVPLLLVALFLVREHAVHAFLYTLDALIPYHASIGRLPWTYFLGHSFASTILPIVLLWFAVAILKKDWQSKKDGRYWERTVLLVSLGFGLLSLVAQGKDYPYHRYLSEIFLLVLAGIDFTAARRGSGLIKTLGVAGLVFGVLFLAPVSTIKAVRYQGGKQEFRALLQSDLNRLGGERLSGHVQCLDTVGGCVGTLEQMRLVQATGFVYDCYLFANKPSPVQQEYRARFWKAVDKNPPTVFVVTNELCVTPPDTFNKLQRWPEFDDYLLANYTMKVQRRPAQEIWWWSHPTFPASYRIYVKDRNKTGEESLSKN